MQCQRCRHRFQQVEKWGWFSVHHGTVREKLLYLCAECTEGALSWIGVAPVPEDLWDHKPPQQMPPDTDDIC